jgi:uncharacterized protein YbjT (DUF2867 family)
MGAATKLRQCCCSQTVWIPAFAGTSGELMRILILGGYGFIGAEIIRAVLAEGFDCVGLGRSAATGARIVPGARWIGADISSLDAPEKWTPHLSGIDAIVNAAGALQDGARDDLDAVHHRSIASLVSAAEQARVKCFVQISAPGAEETASTAFLRTKAAGDKAVRASLLDWIVLKPGLVIGRNAFGGTTLLRMIAGFPLMTPLVASAAKIQTVSIDDVTDAVISALKGEIALRRDYDLVEDAPHSLREIVRGVRSQIGFPAARAEPDLPAWIGAGFSALADLAGWLGWRSPLRSTAVKVLRDDVVGNPAPWREATGRSLRSFDESVLVIPSTAQERLYTRVQLALPVMVASLALFWIGSGVIALAQSDRAAAMLPAVGFSLARMLAIAGSLADIAIGAALLWRPAARIAAVLSTLLAGAYLVAGTILAPALWGDPLGVYVKVIPVIVLGAVVALLLEER